VRTFAFVLALCATTSAWADFAKTNPVTGETENYTWKFTGTDTWNGTGNWQNSSGANPSGTPAKSGENTWDPILFDNNDPGNTININADMSVEGWNLRMGLYNGANVTMNNFVKYQGGTTMWMTVDESSQLTIGGFGGGNITDGQAIKLSVAKANGITWNVNLTSGNANNTFEYYLKGAGSVSYQAVSAANHKIKMADVSLSGTSQVASKTLVSFTSTTKTFTADAIIKVKDSGTLVKRGYVGSVRQSNAAIASTTSTLTTSDAVGSCEIVQCSDGVVLFYVDGSASEVTTYTPSININFTDGAPSSSNGINTEADLGLAGYEVPGSAWNNIQGVEGTTSSTIKKIDSTGTATVDAGVSVAVSTTRGSWNCNQLSATTELRQGYIDESSDKATPTVTITGVPYTNYRVIIYHSTDSPNYPFGYDTINGVNYTYVNGEQAIGTSSWGDAGASNNANPIEEGVNTLVSGILSGSTVTFVAHRIGGSTATARGCFAAIQIVKVDVGEGNLLIPVTGDTTYTVSADADYNKVIVSGTGTLTLDGENQITADVLEIEHNSAIVMDEARLAATTVIGGGTAIYNSTVPATDKGWTDSANWNGTVQVNSYASMAGDIPFNNLGNAESTVELKNVTGWINNNYTCTPKLKITGTLNLNNGHSDKGNAFKVGTLLGSGTISGGDSAATVVFNVTTDWSGFTGTIGLNNKCVVFGSTIPDSLTAGTIYISSGAVVTPLQSSGVWWAVGGIKVDGELRAPNLGKFGGGTTITTTDNGVFTFITNSNADDMNVDYARLQGTGTLRLEGSAYRCISTNNFPTAMTVDNRLTAGFLHRIPGLEITIGSLAGDGYLRSDWGGSAGDRDLKVLQAKDTTWSGKFWTANPHRFRSLIVAPGATTAGTLTLSATHESGESTGLTVESGAKVNLTGTWVGATTVAGTFACTGTLDGNLTAQSSATLDFSGATQGAHITGTLTPSEGTTIKMPADAKFPFRVAASGSGNNLSYTIGDGAVQTGGSLIDGMFVPYACKYVTLTSDNTYTFSGLSWSGDTTSSKALVVISAMAAIDFDDVSGVDDLVISVADGGSLFVKGELPEDCDIETAEALTIAASGSKTFYAGYTHIYNQIGNTETGDGALNATGTITVQNLASGAALAAGNYTIARWLTPQAHSTGYGAVGTLAATVAEGLSKELVYMADRIVLRVYDGSIVPAEDGTETLKIWPYGDSITEGFNMGSTKANYRVLLAQKLTLLGFDVEMVGSYDKINGANAIDPAGNIVKDSWKWHSAKHGATAGPTTNYKRGNLCENVDTLAAQVGNPDVVLLHIGVNDLAESAYDENTTFVSLTNVVQHLVDDLPNSKIVVSTALRQLEPYRNNTEIDAYNVLIRGIMADMPSAWTGHVLFADLATFVDSQDAGILYSGSSDNLHPDWWGHDQMAEGWLSVIANRFSPSQTFNATKGPDVAAESLGAANKAELADYRRGFKRYGVINVPGAAANLDPSSLSYFTSVDEMAATSGIARVGYFVEYVRTDNNAHKWVWVDMDAFESTIAGLGLPSANHQAVVNNLHVKSNHNGISDVAADDNSVQGFVEFSPFNYGGTASGVSGAPAGNSNSCDWNDALSSSGSFSCMQVHRIAPPSGRGGQVLFAFNNWNGFDMGNPPEFGIGNCSQHFYTTGAEACTFDYTHTRMLSKLNASAYTVKTIEVWTNPDKLEFSNDMKGTTHAESATFPANTTWTITIPGDSGSVKLDKIVLGSRTDGGEAIAENISIKVNTKFGTVANSGVINGTGAGQTSSTFARGSYKQTFTFDEDCVLDCGTSYTLQIVDASGAAARMPAGLESTDTADTYSPIKNAVNATTWRIAQTVYATKVYEATVDSGDNTLSGLTFSPVLPPDYTDSELLINVPESTIATLTFGSEVTVGAIRFVVPVGSRLTIADPENLTADKVIVYGPGNLDFNGAPDFDELDVLSGTVALGSATGLGELNIASGARVQIVDTTTTSFTPTIGRFEGELNLAACSALTTLTLALDDKTGTVVYPSGLTTFNVSLAHTETLADDGTFAISCSGATLTGGTATMELTRPDGTTETVTGSASGAAVSFAWTPAVSGKACWIAYEMDYESGNASKTGWENSGTDTTVLHKDSNGGVDIDGDNAFYNGMLYTCAHPYRGGASLTYPADGNWSAVVRCSVPRAEDAAVIVFGGYNSGLIGLVAGADPEKEMRLVQTTNASGSYDSHYITNATMSVVNAATLQHVYVFSVASNQTVSVYCDGESVTNVTFATPFTVGGGFQIGSVLGGSQNTGIKMFSADREPASSLSESDRKDARVDCVRLYKGVLGPNAIRQLSVEMPSVKLYRATVAANATTTWDALDWEPAWRGGDEYAKIVLTTEGDATLTLPSSITAEDFKIDVASDHVLTLYKADGGTTITTKNPMEIDNGTMYLADETALGEWEVAGTGTVRLPDGVEVSGALSGTAKIEVASGDTVGVTSTGSIANTITGSGTITYAALPASALSLGEWTGTVVLPSFEASGLILNNYGKAGSTIALTGITSGWVNPDYTSVAATLRLDGAVNITAMSTRTYTFAEIDGTGNLSFATAGDQPSSVTITKVAEGYSGAISSTLNTPVTITTLERPAGQSKTAGTKLLTISGSFDKPTVTIGGATLNPSLVRVKDDGIYIGYGTIFSVY
jgi:lysophospholipase L1-like esterase